MTLHDTVDMPAWAEKMAARVPRSCWAESNGCSIHYLAWNDSDIEKPGLLLVHGMQAHAHWWDFVAPHFVDDFRVCAIDLSGMGRSNHRKAYPDQTFEDDIVAVLEHANLRPATVVGHSFGGSRVLNLAARNLDGIARCVVLDSRFANHPAPSEEQVRGTIDAPIFESESAALGRFRLLPHQDCPAWMLHHIARHSIRPVAGGWTWNFDPKLRYLQSRNDFAVLRRIQVPTDYLYGGASLLVGAERAREIVGAIPSGTGPVCVAGAGHHLMLDQPLALVAALRGLFAGIAR